MLIQYSLEFISIQYSSYQRPTLRLQTQGPTSRRVLSSNQFAAKKPVI